MATRMKLWWGALLASMAMVGAGLLPPDPMDVRVGPEFTHEEARARALKNEIRVANDMLKRFEWAEEYTTYLLDNAEDGLATRPEGRMTDSAVAVYRAEILEELGGLPVRAPDVDVGVFWVGLEKGGHEGIRPHSNEAPLEYYMGTEGGRAYCFTLKPERINQISDRTLVRYRGGWSWTGRENGLSACRYVAQYGVPGTQIQDWLSAGAIAFGHVVRSEAAEEFEQWRTNRRGLFGVTYRFAVQRPEVDRCMARVASACVEQFLVPRGEQVRVVDDRQMTEATPTTAVFERTTLSVPGNMLFSDLENDFGTEAFHTFWTSEAGVEAAFEEAFGVDIETWIMSWVDENYAEIRRGPALTQSARFGGLITIMLFGLLAGLIERRRKVA